MDHHVRESIIIGRILEFWPCTVGDAGVRGIEACGRWVFV
jgi:hypothetical protein